MELDWVPDYCLACDKQTECDTYCSQSCRLADLEKSSNWSGSTSPTTPTWTSSDATRGSGFYLSPAFNFAAYKTNQITPNWPASDQPASSSQQTSYFSAAATTQRDPSRTLSPSSSRSSLNSTTTTATTTATASSNTPSPQNSLSEQARTELRDYTNSFDSTRNWRRRMTWS